MSPGTEANQEARDAVSERDAHSLYLRGDVIPDRAAGAKRHSAGSSNGRGGGLPSRIRSHPRSAPGSWRGSGTSASGSTRVGRRHDPVCVRTLRFTPTCTRSSGRGSAPQRRPACNGVTWTFAGAACMCSGRGTCTSTGRRRSPVPSAGSSSSRSILGAPGDPPAPRRSGDARVCDDHREPDRTQDPSASTGTGVSGRSASASAACTAPRTRS